MLTALIFVASCLIHVQVESREEGHHRHLKFPDSFGNASLSLPSAADGRPESRTDNNKGFFVQIPHSNPPTVRPPPYTISHDKCRPQNLMENWVDTLCGDLNTNYIPQNPMGHKFIDGGTYPFETIKNKTLEFFRRALPILKTDKSLPKVAKYALGGNYALQPPSTSHLYRAKRGIATREPAAPNPVLFDASYPDSYYEDEMASASHISSRQRRQHGGGSSNNGGFCENRLMGYYNRLCKLYNAMWGKTPHSIQRENSAETRRQHGPTRNPTPAQPQHHHHTTHHQSHHHNPKKHFRQAFHSRPDMTVGESDWTKSSKHLHTGASNNNPSTAELPPTPCPSAAEYLTPVFARNHEGAWRYVVQIPKEGYFTQTVEVTKCLKQNCYYMDGSCKTSPRWQSLLVAEMFYPDTTFPTTSKPKSTTSTTTSSTTPRPVSPFNDGDSYPDYLYSKGSSASLEHGGASYSNELGLPFKKRSIRSTKEGNNKSRSSGSSTTSSQVCDGYDEVGCYQVRLFYDWFLIPGSCKCWKRQFDFTLRSNG